MKPKSSGWIVIAAALVCCTSEDLTKGCINPPCALPFAVRIHLTSAATGDSVAGATVRVGGAENGTSECQGSTCIVPGPPGTYTLTVQAPGFETAVRTVTVRGTIPPCGCVLSDTADLELALVPAGTAGE